MVLLNVAATQDQQLQHQQHQPQHPQQQQHHHQHQQHHHQQQPPHHHQQQQQHAHNYSNSLSNNVASTSSSTSSLNSNASSSFEPRVAPTGGIVMVVPQQQQQQQQQQPSQQQQYAAHAHSHVAAVAHHGHAHHAPLPPAAAMHHSQHSPSDGGSTSSLPASPPLLQQTATPPQGAQIVPPVCAVHHPQQHQQQQLAIVAAMHQAAAAHLAATGGAMGPPPHHHQQHHGPPGPGPQQQQQLQGNNNSQHSQQHSHENGHVHAAGPGVSPSGSSTGSSGGGVGGGSGSGGQVVAAAPPPSAAPQPPPPGPLYIQYPGEFFPAEYYIAPHPHDGMCPQHAHHHQPMCAMPTDYGPTTVQMVSQNRPPPMPVPVQVPQGQVMQQYVNESGTLTHVVLSPQQYQQLHAGQGHIHAPFLTANGTSHFYSPLPAGYPPGPGAGPTHYHAMTGGHLQPQPPPPPQQQQQQPQQSASQQQQTPPQQQQQSMSHSPHSPSPPNSYHKDERSQRQHTKLLRKLEKQREFNSAMSTPAHSPSPRRSDLNGHHNHVAAVAAVNATSSANHNSSSNNNNSHTAVTIQTTTTAAATGNTITSSISSNNNGGHNHHAHNHNNHQQQQQQQQHHVQQQLHQQQLQQQQQHLNNHHQQQQQQQQQHNHTRRISQRNGGPVPPPLMHMSGSVGGGASSVGTSEDGEDTSSVAEDEEDYQASVVEQLSAIQKPEVIDITSRSAKIIWEAPAVTDPLLINTRDLRFNVLLSDRAKECKYKSLYKGESYDCIVQDLQPGQEYVVRLQVHYEKLQGSASEPTEFTTPPCEPDQPMPPKLVMRTKNSLHLRWTQPHANGAPIQQYLLEYDEGKTGVPASSRAARQQHGAALHFVEAMKTKGKHYILSKLQPSTVYNFRLAAINEAGASLYSPICTYSTAGNPPTAPKPPTLQAVTAATLRLVWERRSTQDGGDFVLQMLDRESGHGFLNMYNGSECTYECCQLRRATAYAFRLRAENEAGTSPWSTEVTYKTAPERPGRPGKPHVKGRIHGTYFRVRWDAPTDTGGAEILRYFLEITAGAKFERIYAGAESETTCDRLQPGTTYQLRASCEGPAGVSPFSEVAHITAEAIVPAAPPAPYYDTAPGPYAAVLRFDKPDYNGGAPVLEFELQLRHVVIESDATSDVEAAPVSLIYRGKDAYCVVKDLQPGQTYEAQLRALNRIGAGAWSAWFRFAAAAAAPAAPEAPRIIVKSATHLALSWQEPSCNGGAAISEYRLESAAATAISAAAELEKPAAESESIVADLSGAPATTAFHTCYQGTLTAADLRNLLPFTAYYFRVNASNIAGVSKWSPLVNAQTPAAVPAAPQIKDYEFTANEATLSWTQPECNGAAITAYTIEYASGDERSLTTTDAAAGTEHTIANLTPETAYKFRVQALNAVGAGAYSAYAKLTTLPSPPAPPTLECTGVGHNFIKLKWGDGRNLDFTKFYVEMFVQRAKEFQVVYSGTNCMCKVNKLQERTAYTFRICAGNDRAGVGDFSAEYVFSTTAQLPSNIKAPRAAFEGGVCLLGHGVATGGGSSSGYIPSGMLPETPTSFIAGLGNLSLGVPLTLEWQHSKNSFNDRVEYVLQYAIGKDGDFKKIYRGPETKFTIENLEPGTSYQFRVCPIRVCPSGVVDDLPGQYTSAFRYQVPHLPSIDDIDGSLLNSAAAAGVFGPAAAASAAAAAAAGLSSCGSGMNANGGGGCHGHSHFAHGHSHGGNGGGGTGSGGSNGGGGGGGNSGAGHSHHSHNHSHHSHHNSRHNAATSAASATLHHRSVSASAVSSSSVGGGGNGSSSGGTILIGNQAIGLIPLGSAMANELAANFAGCDDPHHHHHHHHHHHPFHGIGGSGSGDTDTSSAAATTTASLLAATAGSLLANNAALLTHAQAQHAAQLQQQNNHGAIRRYVTKLTSIYTNRKRFTDQEKAVIFMVSFLFFTFLFATLVKMFMR